ncbi:hypothetical protein ACFFSW_04910 [Saccharothrix longispora]|uniref:Secreted protein n=1 Tax=Saccharothrix longispora TaxID=33920 RepID=A0ABU1PMM3_9PSEU|nr:hypothetical protein [Saccharothrix longispora]MDR6591917.1 hypothetical protein [Saccharothrix longispora]
MPALVVAVVPVLVLVVPAFVVPVPRVPGRGVGPSARWTTGVAGLRRAPGGPMAGGPAAGAAWAGRVGNPLPRATPGTRG